MRLETGFKLVNLNTFKGYDLIIVIRAVYFLS